MTIPPNWTPEPWFANDPEYPGFLFHINDEWQVAIFEEPVDAIRAAACVNACAGLNPEAIPELLEACKAVAQAAEDFIALLKRRRQTTKTKWKSAGGEMGHALWLAEAAIADAEGKTE